jgi:hypothetical protein
MEPTRRGRHPAQACSIGRDPARDIQARDITNAAVSALSGPAEQIGEKRPRDPSSVPAWRTFRSLDERRTLASDSDTA